MHVNIFSFILIVYHIIIMATRTVWCKLIFLVLKVKITNSFFFLLELYYTLYFKLQLLKTIKLCLNLSDVFRFEIKLCYIYLLFFSIINVKTETVSSLFTGCN